MIPVWIPPFGWIWLGLLITQVRARFEDFALLLAERGLDPNKWFANVEVIAAEKIGRETVDYVRNINKYYIAYKMYFDATSGRFSRQLIS